MTGTGHGRGGPSPRRPRTPSTCCSDQSRQLGRRVTGRTLDGTGRSRPADPGRTELTAGAAGRRRDRWTCPDTRSGGRGGGSERQRFTDRVAAADAALKSGYGTVGSEGGQVNGGTVGKRHGWLPSERQRVEAPFVPINYRSCSTQPPGTFGLNLERPGVFGEAAHVVSTRCAAPNPLPPQPHLGPPLNLRLGIGRSSATISAGPPRPPSVPP